MKINYIFKINRKMNIKIYKILLKSLVLLTFNEYEVSFESVQKILTNVQIDYIVSNIPIFNNFNVETVTFNTPTNKWFNKVFKGYNPTFNVNVPCKDTFCKEITVTEKDIIFQY